MFSLILTNLALQASAPDYPTVICQPTGQVAEQTLSQIGFQCTGDDVPNPEALQIYLDQMSALLPDRIELPRRGGLEVNTDLEIIYDGDTWRLPEPTPLLSRPPEYPRRAAERGLSGRCTIQVSVSEAGEATQTDIACEQFRNGAPRPSSTFQAESESAFSDMIWLPMPGETQSCGTTTFDFLLSQHEMPDGEVIDSPTCPDAP